MEQLLNNVSLLIMQLSSKGDSVLGKKTVFVMVFLFPWSIGVIISKNHL